MHNKAVNILLILKKFTHAHHGYIYLDLLKEVLQQFKD